MLLKYFLVWLVLIVVGAAAITALGMFDLFAGVVWGAIVTLGLMFHFADRHG